MYVLNCRITITPQEKQAIEAKLKPQTDSSWTRPIEQSDLPPIPPNLQPVLFPAVPIADASFIELPIKSLSVEQNRQPIVLRHVQDVQVVSSIDKMTDTCTVQIASKYKYGKTAITAENVTDLIKPGDTIRVELGYGSDDKLNPVFTGYVDSVAPKDEYEKNAIVKRYIEVKCESNTWRLKQKDTTFKAKCISATNLKDFVNMYIKANIKEFKDWTTDIRDYPLNTINIDETDSMAQTLDFLGRKYNIYFFFNLDTFCAITKDDTSYNKEAKPVNFQKGLTIIDSTLKEKDGTFTAFGEPFVKKGDRITVTNKTADNTAKKEPEKYLVKGVTYKFGISGYRQEVTYVSDLKNTANLAELLRKIVIGKEEDAALICTVISVNKDACTCDVKPDNEKIAPLVNVRLTAFDENAKDKEEEKNKQHWRIIPKIGSKVLVAKINHSDAYVAMFSEIDRVEMAADDTIVFNKGENGGLVKVEALTERLNLIEKAFNDLLDEYKTHNHKHPQGPTTDFLVPSTQEEIEETLRSDIENDKITH